MKKIYSLILATTFAISASAATISVSSASNSVINKISNATNLQSQPKNLVMSPKTRSDVQMAPPADAVWSTTSTGIWYEGPLKAIGFPETKDITSYEVSVQTAPQAPGWYRVNPYDRTSPIAKALESKNNEWLYINATEPSKVYFEDWTVSIGGYVMPFASCTTEGGFQGASNYGTLAGGAITFPTNSFLFNQDSNWYYVSGETKLILDKDNYKDYTCTPTYDFCSANGKGIFNFKAPATVTTVKIYPFPGIIQMVPAIAEIVKTDGIDITADLGKDITTPGYSDYCGAVTCLWVALDEAGLIVNSGSELYFTTDESGSEFKSIGEGSMEDSFITPLFFKVNSETIPVEIEESTKTPGYYRIKNPFAKSTSLAQLAASSDHSEKGHNHYIVINATDPTHVYIEPSPIGLSNDKIGNMAIFTDGYRYSVMMKDGVAEGEAAFAYGKKVDNKITFTKAEATDQTNTKYWSVLNWLATGIDKDFQYDNYYGDFVLTIPSSGVADLVGNDSEAEYFNLQGMKVAAPQKGQILIKRQGGKTTKVAF